MQLHKYNEKVNLVGDIIAAKRQELGLSYAALSSKLLELGVCLYKNDLFLIEKNRRLVRDFELIALFEVLKIDFKVLSNLL